MSPTTLDFGIVNLGQTKALNLTIGNKGSTSLTLSLAASDNPRFAAALPLLTVPPGGAITVPVRFTPTTPGAQTGTLALASNDPVTPSFRVSLRGSGATAGPSEVVLRVDSGTFTGSLGHGHLQEVTNTLFVNRLTPPSYPATIKNVQIYFGNRTDALAVNTPITIASATHPAGSPTISGLTVGTVDLVPATVTSVGGFITYTVPAKTITSGDFVVGFLVANRPGVFPADLDKTPPSQGRSYISVDGIVFSVIDTFGSSTTGNFGIRATVTVGN